MTDFIRSLIMTCVRPFFQGGYDAQVHQHLDPDPSLPLRRRILPAPPEARKVIWRGSFTSVEDLHTKLLDFIEYFNRVIAKPFRGTYTGYGNDSVQNGPLSSQSLHIVCEAEFAFSVEMRTRRCQARGG